MKERPFPMKPWEIPPTLDGRKTQVRRVLNRDMSDFEEPCFQFDSGGHSGPGVYVWESEQPEEGSMLLKSPYGQVGDRLWVRETWAIPPGSTAPGDVAYAVDHPNPKEVSWHPSIHMPRWASRITLEITGIRVESLQDISEEDAKAEGADRYDPSAFFTIGEMIAEEGEDWDPCNWEFRAGFASLWNSLAKPKFTWADNPWVRVLEFKGIAS